jgi:NADH-quinone oxidoreductase subunit K
VILEIAPLLVLASLMFMIGLIGVVFRRNMIVVFMSIELMLNAINLTFVAGSSLHSDMTGQITVLTVMTVAAAEVAIGLAIVLAVFRNKETIETSDIAELKG